MDYWKNVKEDLVEIKSKYDELNAEWINLVRKEQEEDRCDFFNLAFKDVADLGAKVLFASNFLSESNEALTKAGVDISRLEVSLEHAASLGFVEEKDVERFKKLIMETKDLILDFVV